MFDPKLCTFFQGFASQNPMTQQRPGGHSGLSGLSQTGMSQMDFSQDMMRSSVQDSATGTGMLSQDSTYQGNPNATGDDGGFLSQLWTTFEEELDIEKKWWSEPNNQGCSFANHLQGKEWFIHQQSNKRERQKKFENIVGQITIFEGKKSGKIHRNYKH